MNIIPLGEVSVTELSRICGQAVIQSNSRIIYIFKRDSNFNMKNLIRSSIIADVLKAENGSSLQKNALLKMKFFNDIKQRFESNHKICLIEAKSEEDVVTIETILYDNKNKLT